MTLGSIVQWLALQGHKQKVASSSPTRRKLCQDQFGNDLREDFHLDQEWIHTEECSHRHSHEAGDDQKRRNPSRNDVNIEGARCNQDKGRLRSYADQKWKVVPEADEKWSTYIAIRRDL